MASVIAKVAFARESIDGSPSDSKLEGLKGWEMAFNTNLLLFQCRRIESAASGCFLFFFLISDIIPPVAPPFFISLDLHISGAGLEEGVHRMKKKSKKYLAIM